MELVRAGDADGWQQLIDRYQRRLVAFASGRCGDLMIAEDLVQESFVSFLGSIERFDRATDLETILFQILRRRVVDHYRRQGKKRNITACSAMELESVASVSDNPESATADLEVDDAISHTLADAIRQVTSGLREKRNFRDLKVAESVFYAGQKNSWIAEKVGCSPVEVGTVKHRLLQRMGSIVQQSSITDSVSDRHADVIAMVWEQQRPSCPKRTTLGKFVLELLPDDWMDYVEFHSAKLGCIYCNANLNELKDFQIQPDQNEVTDRLFRSTIGFFAGKK